MIWNFAHDGDIQTDFIVEQGTSGNWSYRIWKSGFKEQWGLISLNVQPSGWAQWGIFYYAYMNVSLSTGIFTQPPQVQITSCTSAWAIPLVQDITTSGFKIGGVRPDSPAVAQTYTFSIYVCGK